MKFIKKKYIHYINDHVNIETNMLNDPSYNIFIVYYINCLVNTNYFNWLENQINIVKTYGIIYIIATISREEEPQFKKKLIDMYPNVIIECNYENEFEYRGILKVWELGQVHNSHNDIILYFHSKGVTRSNSYENNRNDSYNEILMDINKIKEIYTIFPSIDKIGYNTGGIGWCWCNFWYARGSYINSVEQPIKTQRRHYYEDWLCRKVINDKYTGIERPITYYANTLRSCYNFYNDAYFGNIGSYYCPDTNRMLLYFN